MYLYEVSYSVDRLYSVTVKANTLKDAEDMVRDGQFDDTNAEVVGEEFLGVNDVECIGQEE